MARRDVEKELVALRALREHAHEPSARAALAKALRDSINLIVARAAEVAGDCGLNDLLPDMLAAFDRMVIDGAKRDQQCWGKIAIAKAAQKLDYCESPFLLKGLEYVQREATFGGPVDTAAPLRGICVLELSRATDLPRAQRLRLMVDRAADAEYTVRMEAMRAIAAMGGNDGSLILRMKARAGDQRSEVTGIAFEQLLAVDGAEAIPLVASYLEPGGEIAEEAALALGNSRLAEATPVLIEAAAQRAVPLETTFRAMSLSRQPVAIEYLLKTIREGRIRDAVAAARAVSIHSEESEIRTSAAQAANQRDPELRGRIVDALSGR